MFVAERSARKLMADVSFSSIKSYHHISSIWFSILYRFVYLATYKRLVPGSVICTGHRAILAGSDDTDSFYALAHTASRVDSSYMTCVRQTKTAIVQIFATNGDELACHRATGTNSIKFSIFSRHCFSTNSFGYKHPIHYDKTAFCKMRTMLCRIVCLSR